MARYLQSLLLVWYFLIVTVARAEQPVSFNHGFLYGRADGDSDPSQPGLQCTRFCEVSLGGSQGPRSLDRRFNSPCGLNHAGAKNSHQPLSVGFDGNENATESRLEERALEVINSNEEAARHVIKILNGPNRPPGFFATGSPAAVQYQRRFGEEDFKFGTGGLHGCTMVAIISKKAVFMGHYWETYSTHGDDLDTGNSRQEFNQRVVNAIRGVAVGNPYNPPEANDRSNRIARNHRYVPPVGDKINFSLFDGEGDNTVMYIMTPVKAGREEDSTDYLYKNKYERILKQEIVRRGRIPGCRVIVSGYKRLVYTINGAGDPERIEGHDDDWAELVDPQDAKGMALFEYDSKTREWRLFWEDKYVTGSASG